MKTFIRYCYCALAAAVLLPGICAAQNTLDLTFRQAPLPARALAIGDAFVSDVHSVSAAILNPSSLAYLENVSVDATAGLSMDNREMQGSVIVPVMVRHESGLAVGGYSSVFDRKDWSKKGGTVYGGTVSYGFRITQSFAIGALYNMQSGSFAGTTVTGGNLGFGAIYTALPSLSYGLSVTGLGSGIIFHQTDTLSSIEREGNVPRSVSMGATWHYPTTHDRVVFNYYLSGQKIIGVDQVIYRMGFEVLPWKFLALRGGVVAGPVTSVGRFGIGIVTSAVEIDYALVSSVMESRMHTMTVSIPFFSR